MATDAERNRGLGAYSTPGVDPKFDPTAPFQFAATSPEVTFHTKQVQPPAFVYIGREDKLDVGIWSAVPNETVNFVLRIMRPDGVVIANAYSFQVTSTRTVNAFLQELTEGFLLSMTARGSGTVFIGQTFVRASLKRGALAGPLFTQEFIANYLTAVHPLMWPGGEVLRPVDGPGAPRSVTGTTPAAGAEISETVPATVRWRLRGFRFVLTTAVAVANRETAFQIDDGANVVSVTPSGFTQAASLSHGYTFGLGSTVIQASAGVQHIAPTTDIILAPGYRMRTLSTALQAADQYSFVQYQVEEWNEQ